MSRSSHPDFVPQVEWVPGCSSYMCTHTVLHPCKHCRACCYLSQGCLHMQHLQEVSCMQAAPSFPADNPAIGSPKPAAVDAIGRMMQASPCMFSPVVYIRCSSARHIQECSLMIAGVPLPASALNKPTPSGAEKQPDRPSSVRQYLGQYVATCLISLCLTLLLCLHIENQHC